MKSKASAPGKVILFGEHFVVYGTGAILCTIDKRVTVIAELIKKNEISITSNIGTLKLEPDTPITEILSPLKPFYFLANKFLQTQEQKNGIKIKIESDIPTGAGLGSSSACCVAGAAAISKLFITKSRKEILDLAIEAEKTIFQNTSGADCTVCTYGGIIEYRKDKKFNKIESNFDFDLVIANSKIKHSTESVVSEVRKFKEKNEREFSRLCEEESRLIEDVLILLKNKNLKELGEKINQNQEYLETIGISNNKLRDMIKIAKQNSFGVKITGAGKGGCIFALTDKSNQESTMNIFKEKNYECFSSKVDFDGVHTF